MRASRRLVPLSLLLAGALPVVIFACNGSSGTLAGGPPGELGEGGMTGADAATEDVSLPSTDVPTSFIVDSGAPDTSLPLNMVDANDVPDGGAKVTVGVVSCGSQPTCNAFASVQCCLGDEGGACLASGVSCPPNSASITCNESADCVVGKVCCGKVVSFDAGTAGLGAGCSAACVLPLPHLCRTNEECADGGACRPQTCSDGNHYELCGIFSTPDDASVTFTCKAD